MEELLPHLMALLGTLITAVVMAVARKYNVGLDEKSVQARTTEALMIALHLGETHIRKSDDDEKAKEEAHRAAVSSVIKAAVAGPLPKSMKHLATPQGASDLVRAKVEQAKK